MNWAYINCKQSTSVPISRHQNHKGRLVKIKINQSRGLPLPATPAYIHFSLKSQFRLALTNLKLNPPKLQSAKTNDFRNRGFLAK